MPPFILIVVLPVECTSFPPPKKIIQNRRSRSQMMSKPRRSGGFYGFLHDDRGRMTPGLEMSLIHPALFVGGRGCCFGCVAKVVGLESHDAPMGLVYLPGHLPTFHRKDQSNIGKYTGPMYGMGMFRMVFSG